MKREGPLVVMVTGGAGFLGQHIVKHLQERVDEVTEIRVFDMIPYNNKLGHQETKPVRSICGDIRSLEQLCGALEGVDVVIHTASAVSFCTFPDMKNLHDINVHGTETLIKACIRQNVCILVYTSTVDVVIKDNDIINGTEALPRLEKTIYPGYGDTKSKAEGLVTAANGMSLARGGDAKLRTVAIRPNVMYGEGDPHYVTSVLQRADKSWGTMVRIGLKGKMQQSYVGNVAWAHVAAVLKLSRDQSVGGRAFFVPDDTPLMDALSFAEPFLKARGFKLTSFALPFWLVYFFLWFLQEFLTLIKPVIEINLPIDLHSIDYTNHTYSFKRNAAEKLLDFKPVYTYQEAMSQSMVYYKTVSLNK